MVAVEFESSCRLVGAGAYKDWPAVARKRPRRNRTAAVAVEIAETIEAIEDGETAAEVAAPGNRSEALAQGTRWLVIEWLMLNVKMDCMMTQRFAVAQ